jgi:hypothetical protein
MENKKYSFANPYPHQTTFSHSQEYENVMRRYKLILRKETEVKYE